MQDKPVESLTWLSKTGVAATASAASCVTDNTSGLTWELKSTNSTYTLSNQTFVDYHDPNSTFRWTDFIDGKMVGQSQHLSCYGAPKTTYGVFHTSDKLCTTYNFMKQVNAEEKGKGFCHKTGWRLPSSEELKKLIDASEKAGNEALKDRLKPLRAEPWKYWTNENSGQPSYLTETFSLKKNQADGTYDPSYAYKIILVNDN